MITVGLTGGIGSGKSTVAGIFNSLGIPVYNSDIQARLLMEQDPTLVNKIKDLLGDEAYTPEGKLNRKWVASKVFADKMLLNQLNHLVHPAVLDDCNKWMVLQNAPYVIKESALLPETLSAQPVDFVIAVSAPIKLRIERVMERDQLSSSEVEARMKNQNTSKVLQ
ncbi:MAG: dephospho-CoA kinase [Saprospiraceae bacterium]|nr:dephospho-CoA kinase [Candidatus Vicinibacter affinis]